MPIYVLSDKPVEGAKNLAIFTIQAMQVQPVLTHYDALIFTSKNGVAVLDAMRLPWKKIPAYAIAPQTAKAIKNRAGNLRYVGKTKHGDSFAHELVPLLAGKRVLYVRGKHVVSSLHTILRTHGIACDEAIVYETVCQTPSKPIVLPKGATIIFSSPSTIHCFLQNVPWDESYHAIAIGRTTAGHFPPHIHPTVADTTSIESCVSKAIAHYVVTK
ncbi:MAG: hypothetical protein KU37_05460 [Sulfuricurvum sp. PC08-66]|nr:MAG: hypothetical protein KU37_05460 [Sulfuricurvum sp. PC08-66]